MYEVLTLLRFGRFDEVLEVTKRPEREVPAAVWDFAQGYANLRTKQEDFARVYLARVQKTADDSESRVPQPPAKHLLGILGGILEGEIARAAGDLPAAIAAFERAVAADDALEYDEPEPLPFPARHWLGAALLEAKRRGRRRARLSRGPEGSSAQRLVAARPAAGAQGAGQDVAPTSTRISRRAGRGPTPGSARRGSDERGADAIRRQLGLRECLAPCYTRDLVTGQ